MVQIRLLNEFVWTHWHLLLPVTAAMFLGGERVSGRLPRLISLPSGPAFHRAPRIA